MPEANLARLGPAVVVVASRDCPDAPGADKPEANCTVAMPCDRVGTPGRLRGGGIVAETAPYAPRTGCAIVAPCRWQRDYLSRCEQRPISCIQEMGRCFLARYRPNVFSEGPGRQKGVSQARYSRDVFPSNVFHRFSRLKSYITSLSCQKQAVRACISAISCHEEAFLPSGAPSGMHDSHFLPLLDARPFHAGHPEGHLAGDPRQEREGTWRGIHAESEIIPTGSSPGEIKGDSDWRTTLFSWRHPPFG